MSQVIDLAIEEYHICFPWETLGLFCSLLFVMFLSICTAKHCLISFLAFEWVRAKSIDLYTLEFTVLLLSVVTSSVNGSDGVAYCLCHNFATTIFDSWCKMLGSVKERIHLSCLLWSFRAFRVTELGSAFLFLKNVSDCWFGEQWGNASSVFEINKSVAGKWFKRITIPIIAEMLTFSPNNRPISNINAAHDQIMSAGGVYQKIHQTALDRIEVTKSFIR